ncbi:TetR/AcrR family transcriptional regulator [Pediococcus argentinicus]|uniref:Transcription regulator n=1 Tax=Pediococcus argentinicus TaxID=480391 RepID=A0A0R2NIN4_9LACO|nr:TetR/AcrR family transcriptional regulator [Pediococcus argentinicus]KRO25654.1 transcription regulator [Pediococcus argentinicus]NKZ22008.1 TetR/AcrR family transcriptional regulator [Pediococcus argentinicus]GEP19179.1 TetR family transcriptional regulator [Pediococcus argentinicus]
MENKRITDLFAESLDQNCDLSEKQKAILRSSLELFAEQGFTKTNTSQIAQKAGVAEGTVYRRFKTKDEILAAILAPLTGQVVNALVEDFTQHRFDVEYVTLRDFLRAVVENRMHFVNENYKVIKVFISQALFQQQLVQTLMGEFQKALQENLFLTLKNLKQRELLVDWPDPRIFQFMAGTVVTFLLRVLFMGPQDVEAEIEMTLDFLEKGLSPE